MATVKKINDRKRAEVKARKDSFIFGNRKERRAQKFFLRGSGGDLYALRVLRLAIV